MKRTTQIEYKVCYHNVETNEMVDFNHWQPVSFTKEQAEHFIKDMNRNRWEGGSSLPLHWKMVAVPK